MPQKSAPNTIAIVGRPNVGKSALFNRILSRRVAIVEKHSGTTRDRLGQRTEWNGVPFELLDTGGIVTEPEEELTRTVKLQAEIAISQASVLLFVVDVSEGVTPLDIEIAEMLRKAIPPGQKKVLVVVNKCDHPARLSSAAEFYSLGFENVIGVSALHGLGIGNLLDEAVAGLPKESAEEKKAALRIAVIGQPNVGKSTFINFLLGEERLIVHDLPGTTRDAIDVALETEDGERIVLIDTGGIRRRRSMSRPIEKLSSLRAEKSVERCDAAILMLDAAKGPTTGDARIAHIVREKNKGCVLVVNKWDLVERGGIWPFATPPQPRRGKRPAFKDALYEKLRFLAYSPVVFTVATEGRGVIKTLDTTRQVCRESVRRVPTPALNDLLQEALRRHSPPLMKTARTGPKKRLKIYYAIQTGVSPPKFRLFANKAKLASPTYRNYLTNCIRASFPFTGSPILLDIRGRR